MKGIDESTVLSQQSIVIEKNEFSTISSPIEPINAIG
jgi:hypothetical protein